MSSQSALLCIRCHLTISRLWQLRRRSYQVLCSLCVRQSAQANAEMLCLCRVPDECSETVASLIAACLQDDPDSRPTARELVDCLSKAAQEGVAGARPRARRPSAVSEQAL